AAALALGGSVQAAGNAAAGKARAQACAGCHGADGNSANPLWPKLAGQHEKYLTKQLADFKAGKTRKDPVMAGQAAGLSKADMENLAAHYAQQKIAAGSADEKLLELGERIYRGGNPANKIAACIACHGPNGAGNPAANFPSLGGQHAAYTEKALKDFRSEARTNDAGKMMRNITEKMTDREIAAVASYIQGLR
ncbi:MAG: cytochrome c4, partial [Pseudomonadota bacterium]